MTIKTDHARLMTRAKAIDVRDNPRRARRMIRTVAKAARLSGNFEFSRIATLITRGLVEARMVDAPPPEVVELPRVTINAADIPATLQ